jgi:hypothetical protein
MADPVTITAIITGLVGAFKAYTEYKAAVVTAAALLVGGGACCTAAAQGEQAAPIIQDGIAQHGEPKDMKVIDNFADDPETYAEALQKMLTRVAERSQPFAQQLQTLAQQANIQTGGVQGTVNVAGQGTIYGTATGVNTGTIAGTYTFTDQDKKDE